MEPERTDYPGMAAGNWTSQEAAPLPVSSSYVHAERCGICHRYVFTIQTFTCRYYGLLENCNHVFCVQCIRLYTYFRLHDTPRYMFLNLTWPLIRCPLCGKPSSCIVSSASLLDAQAKRQKFAEFKLSTINLECPFVQRGMGNCFCYANHCFTSTAVLEYMYRR